MLKSLVRHTSPDVRAKLRHVVVDSHLGMKAFIWYKRQTDRELLDESADVCIVSFPKSGRTWLKMMLGKAIALHCGIEGGFPPSYLAQPPADRGLPKVQSLHEDQPDWKSPSQLSTNKANFASKKVVFLARDIRDLIVSNYFERTKRNHSYFGDLPSFLREKTGGVDTVLTYYKIWHMNRHIPEDFLLVRYEDLHTAPEIQLRRLLDFIGVADIEQSVIEQAVEYASFENMRRMEIKKGDSVFGSGVMRPGDTSDSESYKMRKGKVGGFDEYLTPEDIGYLNEKMAELPDFYHYSP